MEIRRLFNTLFVYFIFTQGHVWATDDSFNCDALAVANSDTSSAACYVKKCANKIRDHIAEELNAAFHYLYMAVYFDQDSINRPGIAKFLYDSASEERQHAILMMEYLNLRGFSLPQPYNFKKSEIEGETSFSYRFALDAALKMEIKVTEAIYKIISDCESDYHGADVFTNPILEEQHEGIRKLKGYIKTFDDLSLGYKEHEAALAEFIFDQKIVQGLI